MGLRMGLALGDCSFYFLYASSIGGGIHRLNSQPKVDLLKSRKVSLEREADIDYSVEFTNQSSI